MVPKPAFSIEDAQFSGAVIASSEASLSRAVAVNDQCLKDAADPGTLDHLWERSPSFDMFSVGSVRLDVRRRLVLSRDQYVRLQPSHFALLLVLARNKDRVISPIRLFRLMWGPTTKLALPRLRLSISRLRRKLTKGRIHNIRIVCHIRTGYRLEIDTAAAKTHDRRKRNSGSKRQVAEVSGIQSTSGKHGSMPSSLATIEAAQ